MCNARTVLPLWAVVVPVNVCNATRYGVRGQRYDNSVYHDGPFVPQGVFKVHSSRVFSCTNLLFCWTGLGPLYLAYMVTV